MLFLRRAHSPDHPPQDSNLLPTDYETRALTYAPPGSNCLSIIQDHTPIRIKKNTNNDSYIFKTLFFIVLNAITIQHIAEINSAASIQNGRWCYIYIYIKFHDPMAFLLSRPVYPSSAQASPLQADGSIK